MDLERGAMAARRLVETPEGLRGGAELREPPAELDAIGGIGAAYQHLQDRLDQIPALGAEEKIGGAPPGVDVLGIERQDALLKLQRDRLLAELVLGDAAGLVDERDALLAVLGGLLRFEEQAHGAREVAAALGQRRQRQERRDVR